MTTADHTPTIHVRGNIARCLSRVHVHGFGFGWQLEGVKSRRRACKVV